MIPLIEAGLSIIEKLIPDKAARDKAKLDFLALQQQGQFKEIEAAMNVVVTEAKSEHWLTANWRPLTMLTFVIIIANNYILYPYLALFWNDAPVLEIPPDMWQLLKIGLGGYVVGRSGEKIIKNFKNGS